MNFLHKLEKITSVYFLLGISFFFFLLRLPSFFEPYWYGDEGVYEVIGYALNHGRFLYQGIWDNKPPLLYLIYALFDGNQQPTRVLSFFVGLASVWVFFFVSKKLFSHVKIQIVTTAVFALLLGSPLLEGNIANAENFMVLPTLIAALIIIVQVTRITHAKKITKNDTFRFFIAGICLGFSFLLKVVGVFDMGAFTLFAFFVLFKNKKHFMLALVPLIYLIIGFCVPVIITILFFVFHHAFGVFLQSTLLSNIGYVNYANQIFIPFTKQVIPQGFLIIKTLVLLCFATVLFWKREKIRVTNLFIWLWLSFSLYSALFSQRPYTHYILVAVPSFCLFLGTIKNTKISGKILSAVAILIIFFTLIIFPIYSKSVSYYQNFIAYVAGNEDTTAYRGFFDSITPRDYAIADYINAQRKPGQTVYIWGNSGEIYKLTNTLPPGRFIVSYHVTMTPKNEEETRQVLTRTPPTFIIILPNQDALPYSLGHYQERLVINQAVIYEHSL